MEFRPTPQPQYKTANWAELAQSEAPEGPDSHAHCGVPEGVCNHQPAQGSHGSGRTRSAAIPETFRRARVLRKMAGNMQNVRYRLQQELQGNTTSQYFGRETVQVGSFFPNHPRTIQRRRTRQRLAPLKHAGQLDANPDTSLKRGRKRMTRPAPLFPKISPEPATLLRLPERCRSHLPAHRNQRRPPGPGKDRSFQSHVTCSSIL